MRKFPVTNAEVDLYHLLCDTFDELNHLRDTYEILRGDLEFALDDISEEIESIDTKITECKRAFRLFERRPAKLHVPLPEESYPPDRPVISYIPENEEDRLPF